MAKQGTITAPTGADTNLRTLGDSTPVRDTLAGICRSALGLAAALKLVIINFCVRKAVIVPTATNVTSVTGSTGVTHLGTFTLDDPTKRTGSWSFDPQAADSGVETELEALIATRKPAFSLESLLNGIEDIKNEDTEDTLGMGDGGFMVKFDQATGEVFVYKIANASNAATAHTAAVALTEDVQYVQTLDSGSAQFGE